MKKKFAVAAATAALITASMTMSVFAADKTADTPNEAETAGNVAGATISHQPGGDVISGVSSEDVEASGAGFIKVSDKIYYVDGDLNIVSEVAKDATGLYGKFYVKDGKAVTANTIVTKDGKTYLVSAGQPEVEAALGTSGNEVKKVTGFQVGNVTYEYLVDANGEVINGWKAIGDKWFYDKADGKAIVHDTWVQTTPGRWFYIGANGEMVSGKNITVNTSGATNPTVAVTSLDAGKTAKLTLNNGKVYVVDENGLWLTGWHKTSAGEWNYYADIENGWAKYGTKWVYLTSFEAAQDEIVGNYAFGSDCYMITGLGKITAGFVYANENGVLQSGFKKIDGVEYYFPTADNAGATGTTKYVAKEGAMTADGRSFFTDKTGKIIVNQWYKDGNGNWYYVDKDGKPVANGPATINGSKYYFESNKMVTAGVYSVDVTAGTWTIGTGKIVLPTDSLVGASETDKAAALVNTIVIDNTGRQINNGWANLGNGAWAYAKDGKAYDGWLLYNGSWYYIDNGLMVTNDYVGNYFLNANGVWTSTR